MRIPSFLPSSSVGKQSQLLLKPTEVELGLQVGVKFDKIASRTIVARGNNFLQGVASFLGS